MPQGSGIRKTEKEPGSREPDDRERKCSAETLVFHKPGREKKRCLVDAPVYTADRIGRAC